MWLVWPVATAVAGSHWQAAPRVASPMWADTLLCKLVSPRKHSIECWLAVLPGSSRLVPRPADVTDPADASHQRALPPIHTHAELLVRSERSTSCLGRLVAYLSQVLQYEPKSMCASLAYSLMAVWARWQLYVCASALRLTGS